MNISLALIMKSFILLSFLVSICFATYSQSKEFEGYIIYRYSYFSPDGVDITEKMLVKNDSVQHYYINRENYISFGQSENFQQLYNSKTNKYFYPKDGNIMYLDAANAFGEKVKFKGISEEKIILGKLCKGIEMTSGENSTIYFFSEEIKVDPEPFKNHNLGGFGPYLKETGGCLSLQIISKNEDHILVMTAEFIQEIELTKEGFDIDALIVK